MFLTSFEHMIMAVNIDSEKSVVTKTLPLSCVYLGSGSGLALAKSGAGCLVTMLIWILALDICLEASPIRTVRVTNAHSANKNFFMYNLGDLGT